MYNYINSKQSLLLKFLFVFLNQNIIKTLKKLKIKYQFINDNNEKIK